MEIHGELFEKLDNEKALSVLDSDMLELNTFYYDSSGLYVKTSNSEEVHKKLQNYHNKTLKHKKVHKKKFSSTRDNTYVDHDFVIVSKKDIE